MRQGWRVEGAGWRSPGGFHALLLGAVLACHPPAPPSTLRPPPSPADCPAYGRDPGGSRYSPAAEITRDNVARLRVAWSYRTGDWSHDGNTRSPANSESTPIYVDGTLYVTSPFGRVIALDPETGRERWEVPLGVHPTLRDRAEARQYGMLNLGGAIITAGGVVFIGATMDEMFRAFDVDTGRLLWEASVPFSATATPMTYRAAGGKQYVVVSAGGYGRAGMPTGDHVVAFALP